MGFYETLQTDLLGRALRLCPYALLTLERGYWIKGFLDPGFVSETGGEWLDEGRAARAKFDA